MKVEDRKISAEVARIIAGAIIKVQRKTAECLKKVERGYSIRQKKVALIILGSICGTYLILVLFTALFCPETSKRNSAIPKSRSPIKHAVTPKADTIKNIH